MIVSNALPIQFWAQSDETYNEKEVCGIDQFCWCQPVQMDDPQVFYIDDEDPDEKTLLVIDEDGAYIHSAGFDSDGVVRFSIPDTAITEGVYQMVIFDRTSPAIIQVLEPTGWTDEAGVWTKNDTDDSLSTGAIGFVTRRTRMPAAVPDNITFTFTYMVTITGVWTGTVEMGPFITDAAGLSKGTAPATLLFTSNVLNSIHSVQFTVRNDGGFSADPMAYLKFTAFGPDGSGTATIKITIFPTQIFYIGDAAILYKSDCIDIREEHECTKLINYTNSSPFAGIDYEVTSPALEFSLRVPVVLFHETYPREDEVHPLSDDTYLRLNSILSRKLEMDIGYMPYYMILKLNLIFMHDTIEIDEEEWVVQDTFEITEGNTRYPLKRSKVLLTDRNFIERNLI